MSFPIGMLEWEPGASVLQKKRITGISTDGAADVQNQSNYHIYRWNAFDSINLSGTVWQVCTFWNTALNLVVGVRSTAHGAWTLYVMDGGGSRPTITRLENDNHNNANCGLDSDGRIHIAYDHHATALHYRKSTNPITSFAGEFGAETSMLGTNELAVSYPTFFRDPFDTLFFIFRDGASGSGDLFMYKYSTGGGTWAAAGGTTAGKVINGKSSVPVQSPYWNGPPEFTSDWDGAGTGYMYLAWIWRETSDTQTVHDMSVVRWNGLTTWSKTGGSAQTMPVTLANCDIASATVAQNHNFTGFNALVLDSSDRPHMFITGDDVSDSNFSKLWHIYWTGAAWTTAAIAGGSGFTFMHNGPDAVIDADDTIRVIVCHATGVGNGLGIYAYVSAGSSWGSAWTLEALSTENTTIVEGGTSDFTNVGGHHDRYQWKTNGVYRMMVPLTGYWKATSDDFTAWTGGYMRATGDAPSSTLYNAPLKIVIDSSNTQFWANVASDGRDIRITDSLGQQFPRDLMEWNYAGQYALISFMYFGELSTAPSIRVYAGNASAVAPATTDDFGQFGVYKADCWGYWPSGGGNDRTGYANNFTMTGSPTTTAATGVMGETTYDYNGTSQYGLATTKVPQGTSIDLIANIKSDSVTVNQVMLSVADGTTTAVFRFISANGATVSDPVVAEMRNGGTGDASKIGYTAGTWYHTAGRFVLNNSYYALIDGVAGTEQTTSVVTPTTATRVGIAVLARSALDAKFDGKLGNAQMWAPDQGAAFVAYDAAQNNQTTFWNGWTWVSAGGNRRRRVLLCGSN